jgi:hypothetical protein
VRHSPCTLDPSGGVAATAANGGGALHPGDSRTGCAWSRPIHKPNPNGGGLAAGRPLFPPTTPGSLPTHPRRAAFMPSMLTHKGRYCRERVQGRVGGFMPLQAILGGFLSICRICPPAGLISSPVPLSGPSTIAQPPMGGGGSLRGAGKKGVRPGPPHNDRPTLAHQLKDHRRLAA